MKNILLLMSIYIITMIRIIIVSWYLYESQLLLLQLSKLHWLYESEWQNYFCNYKPQWCYHMVDKSHNDISLYTMI